MSVNNFHQIKDQAESGNQDLRRKCEHVETVSYIGDLEISNGAPIQDRWPTDLATKAVRTPRCGLMMASVISFSLSSIYLFSIISLEDVRIFLSHTTASDHRVQNTFTELRTPVHLCPVRVNLFCLASPRLTKFCIFHEHLYFKQGVGRSLEAFPKNRIQACSA